MEVPEARDCPKCDCGMKRFHKYLLIPFSEVHNGKLFYSEAGELVAGYVCLTCGYLEFYSLQSVPAEKIPPPE